MKKTFKAALSIICSVMLLASLIIPSLVLPAAAYTFPTGQDTITYTFDGTDFKANATVAGVKASGGQYSVTGGALKIAGDKNLYDGNPRSVIFNNGSDILRLDPGTYAVSFKYRYDYSKHTNNLYCANYNNYKSNAQYFNFTVNTPEGTGVPAGEVGTTIVKDFITTNESISGSTQKEKTVLVNITGSSAVNFGIRSAWLECDVYIDEITIARKTSIEIIPTDGTTTAMAEVISGVPGTAATLPDASTLDGAIAGKVFEGFYADAAFTTPVTQAQTFPTDTITKTIYAKMVVDNSVPEGTIIFDFDNNNAGMKVGNNTVESLRVSGGAFGLNIEKPAAAQGNILSINGSKTADNHGDNRDLLFNDGSKLIPLAAGTYDISYDYFVDNRAVTETANCQNCKSFFAGTKNQHVKFVTLKKSGFSWSSASNTRGVLSDNLFAASVVSETIKNASGSGTVTITVTDQMVADGANYLGLRISSLSYAVWLDNIVIKPVVDNDDTNTSVTIDFEENIEAGATGLVNIVPDGTNKVLSIRGNNAEQVRSEGIKDKDGNEYTLKAGVWKVTYRYKIPETYSAATKVYIIHGFGQYKGELCNIDTSQNYTSGRKLFDNNLVVNSTVGSWQQGEFTFTLTDAVTKLGFTAFGNTVVYLDDVVFTPVVEVEEDLSVTMDFEQDSANYTGTSMLKIEDSTGKDGNPSKVFLASSNDQIRTQLVKDKNGNTYSLKAGKWKVTYDYKVPANASQKLWLMYNVTKTNHPTITPPTNYTTGVNIIDENLVKEFDKGNAWVSGSITFTLDADVDYIGFGALTNGAGNGVYLDNVVFTPVVEKPANTVIMDFENDTANHTGSSMLKIESSTGKDGNPSKVFLASSNDQIRTQLVKDKNDNVYSLTKGVWKVTYDYKVPTNANQKIWLLHDVMVTKGQLAPDGATTQYTSGLKLSDVNLAKVTNMGDTWLSDSVIINVTADEGVKNIGFGAETGNASNAVYIDNVVFTEITDSAVSLSFNTNGGNDIAPVQGLIGETITVADPVKTGFDFVGWYEDSACTIPSDMKFKVGVTTLYAAWTEAGTGLVFNFDTKNKNFATGGNWSGGMYTIQADPKGQSGKTLGLNALTANHNHGDPRDILFNDGASAITLEAGIYKIDYKYYAIYRANGFFGSQNANYTCSDGCNKFDAYYADPSVIKVRFGVVGNFSKTAPAAKAAVTGNIFDMGLITPSYESRWTSGWAILEVTQAMVDAGTNKLVLSSVNLPFTIYLDDIKLNKIDTTPVTLHFDSKGGTSVNSITVQSYTVVNYPTPTKAGYNFTGWVDAYGNPAPTYAPTVNTTFYATWEEAGKYAFIDMDNGFLTGDANIYGSGYFTKNNKFKDDPAHKNTLRFLNTNGSSITRIHLLSSGGRFAQVAPGKIYKVTFDYYVEQLPDANDTQFDFTVNHNDADRWLYNPHKAKRLTGGNILDNVTNKSTDLVGKWMTKEIAVAIPTNITDSRLGILSVNGKGAVVHFDNIKFESIEGDTVLLTYVIPATGQTAYIIGDRGTRIDKSKIPVLNSEKLEFTGWFTDEACTKPFSADVFPSKSMTVYGGTQLNTKGVHINFMDYPWKGDTSSSKISLSVMDAVNDGISYDGDGWALKFDNTKDTQTTSNKKLLLNLDGGAFPLQDGASYIITYRYYLANPVSLGTIRVGFGAGDRGSMWGDVNAFIPVTSHNAVNMTVGKWYTGYATGKVEAVSAGKTFLQAELGAPIDSVVYFDDFVVQQVPDGYSSLVFAADHGTVPNPMVVKTGSTVNLPKVTGIPAGKQLTGWIVGDTNVGLGKYIVNESVNLKASIVTIKFTEGFENWLSQYGIDDHGFDTDYAIYDSKAQGNSADNVKSGRYSLQRLGKEPGMKGYSMFMNSDIIGNELVFGNNYTVSMWVKVVNPVHTEGGIEIRNNDTFRHAWGSSVDPMKVVAIKDIADGQWHKISYTFLAMSRYVSIFTPGNLEIFIDDVTVEYAPNAVVSINAIYNDYVPAFLTEDGKYVKPETEFALNDFELVKRTETVTQGSNHIVELITQNIGATIAIIAGAVVVLAGAAVVIVVLIKKRKAKEVK